MAYLEELLPEFRKGAKIRRSIWDNKEIFVKINEMGEPVLNNGNKFEFCRNLVCSDWELYQEPIDWQYIIDHKCLCWFWDDRKDLGLFGILIYIDFGEDVPYSYRDNRGDVWENCCPVHKNEITFYEDKKDE